MQGAGAAQRAELHGGLMAASKESRETDPFSVRALVRGLSILGLFDVDHREWTIDEMAEQTGLLRMTAYRMVRTLESMAFLVRDPSTNRYRLGPGHPRHDVRVRGQLQPRRGGPAVPREAHQGDRGVGHDGGRDRRLPGVRGHHQHHPPVQAADRAGPDPRRPRLRSRQALRGFQDTGGAGSFCSANRILSTLPTRSSTRDALRAELEQIARDDVAFDIEGVYLGTCAVGAPVRDQVGSSGRHHLGGGAHRPLRAGGADTVHGGGQGRPRPLFRHISVGTRANQVTRPAGHA